LGLAEEADAVKNKLSVIFQNRDFTAGMDPSHLKFTVNSYSFKVIGGCDQASITVYGGEIALEDTINWLRKPVKIYDRRGVAVWWGYVHQVQLRKDALEIAPSLDSMVNRAAVVYSYVATGSTSVGTRKTTAWADDADSQAEFGIKELLSSDDGNSDAAAEARRAAILKGQAWPYGGLSQFGSPRGAVRYSGAKKSASATLICRGWWETLGWKYYGNSGTSSVATTTQIAAIVADKGQFLTATDIDAASGINTSEYRAGDNSALKEMTTLLAAGGANSRRLLASVDVNRRVQVWEEPAASPTYTMNSQAQLFGAGGILIDEYTPPVGVWVRLKDVLSGVVDLTKIVDPSLQFIESATWNVDRGATYGFKGKPSIDGMFAIGGG
jgi:hypothetical protein